MSYDTTESTEFKPATPLMSLDEAEGFVKSLQDHGKEVVFTNGCFDILHAGHVQYLEQARRLGDALIIGLNSDASVSRLKGPSRPINSQHDRAAVLGALRAVDAVILFEEDTPLRVIERLIPDVLVKGGDWPVDTIIGREVVINHGGKVLTIPFLEGRSTTTLIQRVAERHAHPS